MAVPQVMQEICEYESHPLVCRKKFTYPENFPLNALITCNAMNWPGGAAIYLSHKFHPWLMLYTIGQYIVNVQWSMASEGFLTIFKFGIRINLCWYSCEICIIFEKDRINCSTCMVYTVNFQNLSIISMIFLIKQRRNAYFHPILHKLISTFSSFPFFCHFG